MKNLNLVAGAYEKRLSSSIQSLRLNAVGQSLPSSTALPPNEDLPFLPYSDTVFTSTESPVDLQTLENYEFLTEPMLLDMPPGTALLRSEGEAIAPESQSSSYVPGNGIEIVFTRGQDMPAHVNARNDTIDPSMLSRDATGSRHIVGYDSEISQSRIALPKSATSNDRTISRIGASNKGSSSQLKRQKSHSGEHRKKRATSPLIAGYSEMQSKFMKRLDKKDYGRVKAMTDFYFATASPDSLSQLRGLIVTTRRNENLELIRDFSNVAETVRMLDTLEDFQQTCAFLRRMLLLSLANRRDTLRDELQMHEEGVSNNDQSPSASALSSLVLDKLMVEAYPQTAGSSEENNIRKWRREYGADRKNLKNRLYLAGNWCRAVKRFGPGIIALVPTGGEFQIQNQRQA